MKIDYKNINKSKKSINEELKRDFVLETKNEDFVKLCNKLKLNEEILMKYTSQLKDTILELNNCKNC